MVRPRGARGFRRSGRCGLASMYPTSVWSGCAPGHHGYQRVCDLISGQASSGPNGSPVFAYAGKTDPPSLLILSQTLAGRSCWLRHQWLLLLCCSFVCAADRSFVPACARRKDHAGQDAIASVLMHAKARPLLRTAHAMRASLLASAMAMIAPADEDLEDEDLLQMVSAGLLPWVIVDAHVARLW